MLEGFSHTVLLPPSAIGMAPVREETQYCQVKGRVWSTSVCIAFDLSCDIAFVSERCICFMDVTILYDNSVHTGVISVWEGYILSLSLLLSPMEMTGYGRMNRGATGVFFSGSLLYITVT